MATTSSIGSGARTYPDPGAWYAAFTTGGWIGQCYNDSEFAPSGSTGYAFNAGHTTSATDFQLLQCGPGQSFMDAVGASTNPLKYDVTKGVGFKSTTSYGTVITVTDDFTTLQGLQLNSAGAPSNDAIHASGSSATHNVFENLIIELQSPYIGANGSLIFTGLLINSIIITRATLGASKAGLFLGYSGSAAANVTVVTPSGVTQNGFALGGSSGSAVTNCALFGFAALLTGTVSSGSNNCSDLAISFGSANQASKTYGNQFVNTTNASGDWRLKLGADCLDNGATDTTDIPAAIDIVGTARPQGTAWDIGAYELFVAAGPAAYVAVRHLPPILAPRP